MGIRDRQPYRPAVVCDTCKHEEERNYLGQQCPCGGTYVPFTLPILEEIEMLECDCDKCREFCVRPCWPTPDEAEALIDAGYGDRLMEYEYYDFWEPVDMVIPAKTGKGGISARDRQYLDESCSCDFLTDDRHCEIHGALKPIGGRIAHHTGPIPGSDYVIAMMWKTPHGKRVLRKWRSLYERWGASCIKCGDHFSGRGDIDELICPGCQAETQKRRKWYLY